MKEKNNKMKSSSKVIIIIFVISLLGLAYDLFFIK